MKTFEDVGERLAAIDSGDIDAIRDWFADEDVCHSSRAVAAVGFLLAEIDTLTIQRNEAHTSFSKAVADVSAALVKSECRRAAMHEVLVDLKGPCPWCGSQDIYDVYPLHKTDCEVLLVVSDELAATLSDVEALRAKKETTR